MHMAQTELLTIQETMEMLRLSRRTLHRHTKSGVIPSVRIGGRRFYRTSDVELLLAPHADDTGPSARTA